MKKIFLSLFLAIAFISCQDDVRFNNPSFQVEKNKTLWKAIDFKTTIAKDGSLTIDAYRGPEKITLKTPSTILQSYELGGNTSTIATYTSTSVGEIISFSTGAGFGNGEIVITEYDITNHTMSGNFKFNAEKLDGNTSDGPVLNFNFGVFYKIPVTLESL